MGTFVETQKILIETIGIHNSVSEHPRKKDLRG